MKLPAGNNVLVKSLALTPVLLIFLSLSLCAQIGHGGYPRAEAEILNELDPVEISLPAELESEGSGAKTAQAKNSPFIYAHAIPVNLDPYNSGLLSDMPGGGKLWQLSISSKGAYSLNLLFDSFKLAPGAEMFVYSSDKKSLLGAFTASNNKGTGMLAIQPIPGDRLVVECYFPKGALNRSKLSIGRVGYGFKDLFSGEGTKDGQFGESGDCNVDINCEPEDDWQLLKRSVVRLSTYYDSIDKWGLCTGVLVNNTDQDRLPYLVTANHCIQDQEQAFTTVAVFNYESPYCNGLLDGSVSQAVSAAWLRATNSNIDFSLVQLSKLPPMNYRPYYAGWDVTGVTPSSTTSIHHPSGDVKKISMDLDSPATGTLECGGCDYDENVFWNIEEWDAGTTEIGSSGAPLFDQGQYLKGTLVGGSASCANSVNDYYQKISESWDNYASADKQLKAWLDPGAKGIVRLTGMNPYASVSCDHADNIGQSETLILKEYTESQPEDGYWTGHNIIRITGYAEKIISAGEKNLVSLACKIADVEYNSPDDDVVFKIWTGTDQPEELVAATRVPLENFSDSSDFEVYFDTIYHFSGNFWAGYELEYDNPAPGPLTDRFSLFQADPRDVGGENTAMFYKNDWHSFDDNPWLVMRTSLAISAGLCDEIPVLGIKERKLEKKLATESIYPNPTTGKLTVDLNENRSNRIDAEVFNISGRLLFSRRFDNSTNSLKLDISGLNAGIYILKIKTDGFVTSAKITLIR